VRHARKKEMTITPPAEVSICFSAPSLPRTLDCDLNAASRQKVIDIYERRSKILLLQTARRQRLGRDEGFLDFYNFFLV
jgi:hypothetical protein